MDLLIKELWLIPRRIIYELAQTRNGGENVKKGIAALVTAIVLAVTAAVYAPPKGGFRPDTTEFPEPPRTDFRPWLTSTESITLYILDQEASPPPWAGGGKPGGKTTGYKIIAKWMNTPVTYIFDYDGSGLSEDQVRYALSAASEEWDSWTSADLANNYVAYDETANFDPPEAPDTRNEVSWGNYPTAGVIAVCRMWGVFSGKPSQRQITEFDIMFDTDYAWGDAKANPTVMDLQNIATHELGHGIAGLDDMYDDTELTMYAYSTYGEIKKRDLAQGDINGVQANYGK